MCHEKNVNNADEKRPTDNSVQVSDEILEEREWEWEIARGSCVYEHRKSHVRWKISFAGECRRKSFSCFSSVVIGNVHIRVWMPNVCVESQIIAHFEFRLYREENLKYKISKNLLKIFLWQTDVVPFKKSSYIEKMLYEHTEKLR